MKATEHIPGMIRRMVERTSPAKVVLYGSYARGEADQDSDVDLLVLFDELTDRRGIVTDLYDSVSEIDVPKDIIIATVDEFERFRLVENTTFFNIDKDGKVVFDSRSDKARFQVLPGRYGISPDAGTEEIVHWFVQRGDRHLYAADVLVTHDGEEAADAACYHAEEAVDKYLKALLTLHGIAAPRTHDLNYIHNLIPREHRLDITTSDLIFLSTYGIERWWDPDHEQARKALAVAQTVSRLTVEKLPTLLQVPEKSEPTLIA